MCVRLWAGRPLPRPHLSGAPGPPPTFGSPSPREPGCRTVARWNPAKEPERDPSGHGRAGRVVPRPDALEKAAPAPERIVHRDRPSPRRFAPHPLGQPVAIHRLRPREPVPTPRACLGRAFAGSPASDPSRPSPARLAPRACSFPPTVRPAPTRPARRDPSAAPSRAGADAPRFSRPSLRRLPPSDPSRPSPARLASRACSFPPTVRPAPTRPTRRDPPAVPTRRRAKRRPPSGTTAPLQRSIEAGPPGATPMPYFLHPAPCRIGTRRHRTTSPSR